MYKAIYFAITFFHHYIVFVRCTMVNSLMHKNAHVVYHRIYTFPSQSTLACCARSQAFVELQNAHTHAHEQSEMKMQYDFPDKHLYMRGERVVRLSSLSIVALKNVYNIYAFKYYLNHVRIAIYLLRFILNK